MPTPENLTTINPAAMLAFKSPTALFGLVATPAIQNSARRSAPRQYGGSPIAVSYLAASATNPPEELATPVHFELDASDLIDGQEQLSGFFDHEGLAHLCVPVDVEQVQAGSAIESIPLSSAATTPMGFTAQQTTHPYPLAYPATLPVLEAVASFAAVPPMECPQQLDEQTKADPSLVSAVISHFKALSRQQMLAAAICVCAVPATLGGAGYLYTQFNEPAAAVKATRTESQQLTRRTAAPVKRAPTVDKVIAPSAQPLLAATVAAPLSVPRMASTVLPMPLPLPASQMDDVQVAVPSRSMKNAPAPAPAQEKNKIILLEVEEPIAQKEDIPSPGKFVLLKTDSKPAPSKFKVLGDKQP